MSLNESMMTRTISSLLVFVVAIHGLTINALMIRDTIDQLSYDQRKEAASLIPAFDEIDSYLESSNLRSTKAQMDLVEMFSWKRTSILDRFAPDAAKRSLLKKAFKLFLSLPDAAKSCDYQSYKIFAMNHLALEVDKSPNCSRKSVKILNEYSEIHAKLCRSGYELDFQTQLKQEQGANSYHQIQEFFQDFEPNEHFFDPTGQSPKLSDEFVGRLAARLSDIVKDSDPNISSEFLINRASSVLDNNLVDPCKLYYKQFKGLFASAIYDSAIEDADQDKLLYPEDGDFGEGLRYFRACGFIAKNSDYFQERILRDVHDWH